MLFSDSLTLDAPKRTKEGFLAVRAKAARTGIQEYLGRELDRDAKHFQPNQLVRVYRPPEEVFSKDSVHSFLLKPLTDDHPSVPVTADNWSQHARGVNAGAMRDGDFLAFDLVLMDSRAIASLESGKKQLSNGYSSDLDITGGVTDDGQPYDAVQRNIRGNHIALVKAGRAGAQCCIGDAAVCDSISADVLDDLLHDGQTYRANRDRDNLQDETGARPMKTITVDGMPIEVSDQAEAAIRKLEGQLSDSGQGRAKSEGEVATLTAQLATKDAELVTVKAQLEAAQLTPQQLRDAAKGFQLVVDKAKALGVNVTDAMDEASIIKAVVLAKVGDASKDWSDEQLAASFATLSTDASRGVDPLRDIIKSGAVIVGETAAIRDAARQQRYN